MSNHLSPAVVAASLKQVIQDAITIDFPGAVTRLGRPGSEGSDAAPAVNIFLYQVTPLASARNEHLGTRSADGRLRGATVVAMELHFLLSFYGGASNYDAERLLGSVSRAVEHKPIVTASVVKKVIQESAGILDNADLHLARETVRASPVALSLDDMSKLWSVLFQVPYVLSVAYRCGPVLIETSESGSPGLPVTQVGIGSVTMGGPVFEGAEAEAGVGWPIVWGSKVVLKGKGLSQSDLIVKVGGLAASLAGASISDTRIVLPLVAATFAGSELPAGSVLVEAILPPPSGGAAYLTRVSDSTGFTLRASVALAPNGLQITPPARPGDPVDGTITIIISPKLTKGQQVRLLLDQKVTTAPKSYQLTPTPVADNAYPLSQVTFPFESLEPGDYIMHVSVDSTLSAPQIDTNANSAKYRQIVGPSVKIP
jgi:hypothetical protein